MDETTARDLSADVVETIRLAARKLTGFRRREFQAEVAVRYCDGNARRTERMFGWGRDSVNTGLGEKRSGLRCVDAFTQRGRKKSEEKSPQLVEEIQRIVDPTAQADPKFQTTLAYTRITAAKVRAELLASDPDRQDVPCRETVGAMLNRLGYRLQRVLKTRPQKSCPKRTRSSRTFRRRELARRPIRTA